MRLEPWRATLRLDVGWMDKEGKEKKLKLNVRDRLIDREREEKRREIDI